MANNAVKWVAGATALTTVLNTELNNLANNTVSALGTAIDLSANKDQRFNFELILSSLTPTAGGYVALYVAAALDGSNYADNKREMQQHLIGMFYLDTATAAKRTWIFNKELPPTLVKFYVDNQAGVAVPANNNSFIKIIGFNPEIQG